MRGIYLLVTSEHKYLHWAVNLAASIKYYSPNADITLLHERGFLPPDHERHVFNSFVEISDDIIRDENGPTPGVTKLNLYHYFNHEENLYIDVDSLIIKDIDGLFDLCKDKDIAMDVVWSGDQNSESWPCVWMDLHTVKSVYELPSEYKIYEVNSSYIYTKKNKAAESFWKQALSNIKEGHSGWGRSFPDELAFDVATAQCGINPQLEFNNISWSSKVDGKPLSCAELAKYYYMLTFWGNKNPSTPKHYKNYDDLCNVICKKILGRQNHYKAHILMEKKYTKTHKAPISKPVAVDPPSNGKQRLVIVGRDNGVGLTKDKNILTSILTDYDIIFRDDKKSGRSTGRDEICIFTEVVDSRFYGRYNILIPNQEWFYTDRWVKELKNFQQIWVKTKLAYDIFSIIHPSVKYIGFTSVDMYKEVEKVKECFHTRGKSSDKGTEFLYDWPGILPLNVISDTGKFNNANHIKRRLDDKQFIELANKCLIHICPSTMEGFGHYINEAKSMGNVVITTDSAPMNEIIKDKRFLCKVVQATSKHNTFGTYTKTNISEIEKVLAQVKNLDLIEIGKQNRIEFLEQDKQFKDTIKYELSKI